MATPIGDLVKIQVSEVVNSFGSKTQSKLNATDGIIQVRVSTANNKITLEWDAIKKEDAFKYSYKASNTKGEANWTNKADVTADEKSRTVTIEKDSNDQPLTNKTKVEYKIYDSNDQLVASGIVAAKIGKDTTTGGSGGTGGGSTETTPTETLNAGQKLTIADKEYTVIENVEGSKYKVLATETFQHRFDASSNKYLNSEIATYLDKDYFKTLPEPIKDAIVPISIQQKKLKTWNSNNPTDWYDPIDAGTHKVFIPSWDEVTKIYGTTPTELTAYSNGGYGAWLRDAYNSHVLGVYYGNFSGSIPGYERCVRPAFVINLSNVDYTKK